MYNILNNHTAVTAPNLQESFTRIIIYIKILLDCDWLISVQLIVNSSAIFCIITVQFSVITVQKSVTN